MTKAVFTSSAVSEYNDTETSYHFPRTYLNAVQQTVGDMVVYYEPRRGGNLCYYAVAEVVAVRADPNKAGLFYADLRNYLQFERQVPFREGNFYYESKLQKLDGSTNRGAFGRAVRLLSDHEFDAILAAGFDVPQTWPEDYNKAEKDVIYELGEHEQAPFQVEREAQILSRPFRDRAFTRIVQRAYDRRCAVTGLQILNGGGRPEVQAAHIWSVADGGPDSVRNGIALSGTMHWLFDRGLMTITETFEIKIAANDVPSEIQKLVNPTGKLIVPKRRDLQPSPSFIRLHNGRFKG